MKNRRLVLELVFYKTSLGTEPVREWLRGFSREEKREIGNNLKTAQFGWPLGMPLIRKMEKDLWEVRSHITDGIVRIFFTVNGKWMVLLHGFAKKSHSTPLQELDLARKRKKDHYDHQ